MPPRREGKKFENGTVAEKSTSGERKIKSLKPDGFPTARERKKKVIDPTSRAGFDEQSRIFEPKPSAPEGREESRFSVEGRGSTGARQGVVGLVRGNEGF